MKAGVYYNGILAGILEKTPAEYLFTYTDPYMANSNLPSISLTLPKSIQQHQSAVLFSFFSGLLSEGINKDIQCRLLKIDEDDEFTRLIKTAGNDTIGAITVTEFNEHEVSRML